MAQMLDLSGTLAAAARAASMGDAGTAAELLRQALTFQEASLGSDHPDLATTLNNLALMCERLGRVREAGEYYRRAYALVTRAYGADNPPRAGEPRKPPRVHRRPPTRAHGPARAGRPLGRAHGLRRRGATSQQPGRRRHGGGIVGLTSGTRRDPRTRGVGGRPCHAEISANGDDRGRTMGTWPHTFVGPHVGPIARDHWEVGTPTPLCGHRGRPDRDGGLAAWALWPLLAPVARSVVTPGPVTPPAPSAPAGSPPVAVPAPAPSATPAAPHTSSPAPQPAAPPRTAHEPPGPRATAERPPAEVAVVDARLCATLTRLQTRWTCTPLADASADAYYMTRIRSSRAVTVRHRWRRDGRVVRTVSLQVDANTTTGFRTFSFQRLGRQATGDWAVELLTPSGAVLDSQRFTVR